MPRVDHSWVEVEIKKAKLFEKYVDAPVENCDELLSHLMKELDERNARLLAAKILLQRAERRSSRSRSLGGCTKTRRGAFDDSRRL
jgi:hypothetical protein